MSRRALMVLVTAVVLAVSALAWNAGELHRENCLHAGRRACSVLPWENGRTPKVDPLFRETQTASCILYGKCP